MSTNEPPTSPEGVSPADGWFDTPTPPRSRDGDAEPPRSGTSIRTWIAAGVGAAALTAGAIIGINVAASSADDTAAASAQQGASGQFPGGGGPGGGFAGGPGGGTVGTIASIDGSTLEVETMDGSTVQVATTADTEVVVSEDGDLADIEVGDHLAVEGSTSGDEIAANRLIDTGDEEMAGLGAPPDGAAAPSDGAAGQTDGAAGQTDGATGQTDSGPSMGGGRGLTRGTVTAIEGDTITLSAEDGSTVTVTASDDTTVSIQRSGAVSDLDEGDTVMVRGETSDGTVTATSIRSGELPGGRDGGGGMPPTGGPGGADSGAGGSGGMPGQGSSSSSTN